MHVAVAVPAMRIAAVRSVCRDVRTESSACYWLGAECFDEKREARACRRITD